MNARVLVKHLAPADDLKSEWLNNVLAPAVEACRFDKVPGARIVPLSGVRTRYSGLVERFNYEWGVSLSISVGFWRRETIIHIYLHECAHLLLINEERRREVFAANHGPAFFLTNLVLCARVDSLAKLPRNFIRLMTLYDYEDCPLEKWPPAAWRSAVIEFAFSHYAHLAESDLSAEAVAREAWNLWEIELKNLLAQDQTKADEIAEKNRFLNERDDLKIKIVELERQRDVSYGWRFLFMGGWKGLMLVGFLVFGVYTSAVVSISYGLGMLSSR